MSDPCALIEKLQAECDEYRQTIYYLAEVQAEKEMLERANVRLYHERVLLRNIARVVDVALQDGLYVEGPLGDLLTMAVDTWRSTPWSELPKIKPEEMTYEDIRKEVLEMTRPIPPRVKRVRDFKITDPNGTKLPEPDGPQDWIP